MFGRKQQKYENEEANSGNNGKKEIMRRKS